MNPVNQNENERIVDWETGLEGRVFRWVWLIPGSLMINMVVDKAANAMFYISFFLPFELLLGFLNDSTV